MPRASREWVTFADPEEEGRVWQLDVTFLLSSWQCIFGAGCQGVLDQKAPELVLGCCSYGAYFADTDDRDHVARIAAELDRRRMAVREERPGQGHLQEDGPRRRRQP